MTDIEKDRVQLEANSEFGKITIRGADFLSSELLKKPLKSREKKLYHFFNLQNTGIGIPHHDRTITQLKYSGKFRIIRNKTVADAMIDYDTRIIGLQNGNNSLYKMNVANNTLIDIAKVFDLTQALQFGEEALVHIENSDEVNYPSNLRLLSYDEKTIMQLRNTLVQGRTLDAWILKLNNELWLVNRALDSLIREEYFD